MSEESLSQTSSPLPARVVDLLKSTPIGYLSLTSKKGDIYTYPMAYHYSDHRVYFITPLGSAKMKLMRTNPKVSFIVDNKKVNSSADTKAACGAMFQGKTRVFSFARMVVSLISKGPMGEMPKKYPGMFSFYLKGKGLPHERKFHKYRLIRIDPTKIVYWEGYEFGRYVPERSKEKTATNSFEEIKGDPSKLEGISGLIDSADEELEMDQIPVTEDWLAELKSAVSTGILSQDEMTILGMNRRLLGTEESVKPGELSSGEKSILRKWKSHKGTE